MPQSPYVAQLRRHIGHDTILAIGAAAVIRNEQGQILLLRRGDGLGWSLPAGMMEPGERIAECIVREVREETGLEVEPVHLDGIYSDPALMHVTYPNGDQVHYMSATFTCRVIGGSLSADGDEALEISFFDPESLPETTWPMHRVRIQDALASREAALVCQRFSQDTILSLFRRGSMPIPPYVARLRKYIGHATLMLPAAAGIIFDPAGRVLLIRRGDGRGWSLPGGMMEPGETIVECVVREVWEETGLEVEPVRLVGVYSDPAYTHITYPNGDRVHFVSATFECRVTGGEMRADGEESLAVSYFSPQGLPSPLVCDHEMRVRDALSGRTAAFFR